MNATMTLLPIGLWTPPAPCGCPRSGCQLVRANPDRYDHSGAVIIGCRTDNHGMTIAHPALIVDRPDHRYRALALTSKRRSGRRPVPGCADAGLDRQTYLYSTAPIRLSGIDLGDQIGWAPPEMLDLAADILDLYDEATHALYDMARCIQDHR